MKETLNIKEKEAQTLFRELKKVWEKQRKLGYHSLPKPRQMGWRAQFKLRNDILRRQTVAPRYLEILAKIQNYQISRTTKFPKLGELALKTIPERDKKKFDWPEYYWTKYFRLVPDPHRGYKTGVEFVVPKCYKILHDYLFEIEIVPHFVDKLPIIDPALDSREKEIRNKLNKHPAYHKVWNGGCRCSYCNNDEYNQNLLKILIKETKNEL